MIKSDGQWIIELDGKPWTFRTEWQATRFAELVDNGADPAEAAETVQTTSDAAAALGRITSPEKAKWARINGRKGGRPRKVQSPGATGKNSS